MSDYKSSVLRCHDPDDHDCVTCRFLSGDESREVLLGVISSLDHVLADKESLATTLLTSVISPKRQLENERQEQVDRDYERRRLDEGKQ